MKGFWLNFTLEMGGAIRVRSYNILLERFLQDINSFDAKPKLAYIFKLLGKILASGYAIRKGAVLKFPMGTFIEIEISQPSIKAFKQKLC